MSKRNIEAIYPLSPMQQGMLFHSIYSPGSGVYCEVLSCVLNGSLDVSLFEKSWKQVIDRHAVFRTSFVWKRLDRMLQVVQKDVSLPLEILDWKDQSENQQKENLERIIEEERNKGFDLAKVPLIRLKLIQVSRNVHWFVWVHHHIILDGWSMPIVFKDLLTLYEGYEKHQPVVLGPVRPYRDYITWLQEQKVDDARNFWSEHLSGFHDPTFLVFQNNQKTNEINQKHIEKEIRFSKEETEKLFAIAKNYQVTINTLLQGAWSILLSKYCGRNDVVFGSTVSGRPPELENFEWMVGLFINTLPVRVKVDKNLKVADFLKNLHAQSALIRQFEYYPLYEIQDVSNLTKGTALFDSILVFENYPLDSALHQNEFVVKINQFKSYEQTNYPITVVSSPSDPFLIKISYDSSLFESFYIDNILSNLKHILISFSKDPGIEVNEINLLSENEKQEILIKWNLTDFHFENSPFIHELIEEQAEKKPEQLALISPKFQMTFDEMNKKANQLANFIKKRGISPDERIGVCLNRSPEMILALIAVMKSGGAYVPIDPKLPYERISYLIEDAEVKTLITHSDYEQAFRSLACNKIYLDHVEPFISLESNLNLGIQCKKENLVYVIYTSGTTGKPKGVMIEHQSLSNLVNAQAKNYGLTTKDRVLQFISISFDAAAEEIYPALVSGATLLLPEADMELTASSFLDFCYTNRISFLHLPVALWHQLTQDIKENNLRLNDELRLTVVGGESPSPELIIDWYKASNRVIEDQEFLFFNSYGPTETTITAAQYKLMSNQDVMKCNGRIPIGKPVDNVKIYILDQDFQPCPIGVPGEIFIAGVALSRGYLNRPELTKEKFIQNPTIPNTLMYRSGDYGRYLPDGNIEFLGRIDQQVKIRGYRIELEEIEKSISTIEAIKSVAVDLKDFQAGKLLVAYLVLHVGRQIDESKVRDVLKSKLPDYMIPGVFLELDKLPLLPSGKIDRKALPLPDISQLSADIETKDLTPIQDVLVSLWSRILNIDHINLMDNFFHLGGHSLTATQLISRIRDAFEIDVEVSKIFEYPTLIEQSLMIEKSIVSDQSLTIDRVTPGLRTGDIPLSYSQQRLWFLDQLSPGNVFYNIPIALRLRGNLNIKVLEWSLNQIIKRHEVLRTVFKNIGGKPVQVIEDFSYGELALVDFSYLEDINGNSSISKIIAEQAKTPFDLTNGPMYRSKLLRLSSIEHILILTLHHIVTDGWSMGIMVKELIQFYENYNPSDDGTYIIQPLPIQYADYAIWQRDWLSGERLEQQLEFWQNSLVDAPKILDLPTDCPRPAILSSNGAEVTFTITKELTEKVKMISQEVGVTLFITLLSTYQLLFHRYTSMPEILVGVPIANRNRVEIENLIGFFINTLVMKADFHDDITVKDYLKKSRKTVINAYLHQDLPFELLVEALRLERDLSHSPVFQVAFTLQNTPIAQLSLPELEIEPISIPSTTSKYDITLVFNEMGDHLVGTLEYNTDLFQLDTIQNLIEHYQILLEGMVKNPEDRILHLPLLTEREQKTILKEWNLTDKKTPTHLCAHQLFEIQVEKNPNHPALFYEGNSLSYNELNQKANQLAHYLIKSGVGIESIVGISTNRSMEMIIGILGVMKVGAAYLPLDPNYPFDRLAFMYEDSKIDVLLSQKILEETIPTHVSRIIWLDSDWSNIQEEPVNGVNVEVKPDNLAYVIYTSGSTGKPKGTLLTHRGLSNLAETQRIAFNIRPESKILQFSPYSFDASVWEIFMALGNGATLYLFPQELLSSGQELIKALKKYQITNMTLPPSVLRVLPEEELEHMETVIAAGEACTPDIVSRWSKTYQFFNAYGPTETTVCASMYRCGQEEQENPPIGKPILNTHVYILDENQQPVPVGIPGELFVGGVSVARGYLNRPEITKEKFLVNPFNTSEKLYRTGDLVKYRKDGNIVFLGRIDQQVKVRGFRIELGEIESAIAKYPTVNEAVVVAREDRMSEKRIIAYITTEANIPISERDLRSYLKESLPDYMIPSGFMFLDKFPLSPSGKVDRKGLPAPDVGRTSVSSDYIPPNTDIEKRLCQICSELLNVEKVGIMDSFFELGGHSLLATQLLSRIRDEFQVEISVRYLFENPTIQGIAKQIELTRQPEQSESERIARLFARINELSDEEVRKLLEEKKSLASRKKENE